MPFKVMVLLEVLSLSEAPSPSAMFKGQRSEVWLARDKEKGEKGIFSAVKVTRMQCVHRVYLVLAEARKEHQIPLGWRYCGELACGCWNVNSAPV